MTVLCPCCDQRVDATAVYLCMCFSLSTRTRNALANNCFVTIGDLLSADLAELQKGRRFVGLGKAAIAELSEFIARREVAA